MQKPKELQALTGIRFYAALLVFLSHVSVIPGMEKFSDGILLFNSGAVAVSCFFVLSGFILTYNYASVFHGGVSMGSYKRFVWDRWTKIYPVHLATLLAILPIQILSPNLPLDWRAIPLHALLVQCFWPFSEPAFYKYLNVPSWSVSCELFFYLVAPVTMSLGLRKHRLWTPVVLTLIYASALGLFLAHHQSDFTRFYLVSCFAPSRFPEFLIGIVLARVFLSDDAMKIADRSRYLQATGILLIFAGALCREYAPWPFWGGLLYAPGAASLILGLAYERDLLANHLRQPLLIQLGKASFCLYMMQAPILRGVKGICVLRGWEVRSWVGFCAVLIGMFLLIQCAALIMHRRYELPLQRKLRRLASPRAGSQLLRSERVSKCESC